MICRGFLCTWNNPFRTRDTLSRAWIIDRPQIRYIYLSMIVNNLMAGVQRTELLARWETIVARSRVIQGVNELSGIYLSKRNSLNLIGIFSHLWKRSKFSANIFNSRYEILEFIRIIIRIFGVLINKYKNM